MTEPGVPEADSQRGFMWAGTVVTGLLIVGYIWSTFTGRPTVPLLVAMFIVFLAQLVVRGDLGQRDGRLAIGAMIAAMVFSFGVVGLLLL